MCASQLTSVVDDENVQRIRTWLSPTEYYSGGSEYRKNLKARVPGTGDWLFQTNEYRDWHDCDASTLWLQGPSGCGKSVLAANLIRRLQQENSPVLFFFSRRLVRGQSYPGLLVRDCLSQCMPHSSTLQSQLEILMRQYPTITKTPFDELWGVLISALSTLPRVYLVFDALNELNLEANKFSQRMVELEGLRPDSVKLVKTSRSEVELQSNPSTISFQLAGSIAQQDLQIYINHRLIHQTDRIITTKEQLSVKDTLCNKGNGTFLYCRLVLDEIVQQSTPVLQSLQTLPDTLQDLYVYLLHEQSCRSGASLHFQFALLSCITHTSHPLRVIELAALINSQTNRFGLEDNQDAKLMVHTACGPLVEISDDGTAKLLHSSVTEFILDGSRNSAKESEVSEFWFPACEPSLVHRSLAGYCINYLVSGCLRSWTPGEYQKESRSSKTNELMEKFRFLSYASGRVFYHTEMSELDPKLISLLDNLLLPGSHHFESLKDFCLHPEKSDLPTIKPLHVAVMAGLTSYAKHLLEKGEDPDQIDSEQRTAAINAVRYEASTEIMAVLLDHGASLTKWDSYGSTPLHYAAQINHFEMLRFLLDSGANPISPKSNDKSQHPSSISSEGKPPIRFSCELGYMDAVLELLKRMDSQAKNAIQPHWMGSVRQPKILSVLLKHSEILANINEKDELGNTALRSAILVKDPDTVEILLQHGADMNIGAQDGKGPLQWWASSNAAAVRHTALDFEKTGILLLAHGCDVDAKNDKGQTVLMEYMSRLENHGPDDEEEQIERFISLLLKHGASSCVVDDDGNTLLHRYVDRSKHLNTRVVKLLTEAGAEINKTRKDNLDTPLMAAVKTHRSNIMALLECGAHPSIQDADGNTAMHHVCRDSHMWSVSEVRELAKYTDLTIKNNKGETCIYGVGSIISYECTPYKANSEIIPLLVKEGVDLESRDHSGRTALLAMCRKNQQHDPIASLIQCGANVKSRDSQNKSCFHMVAISYSYTTYCEGCSCKVCNIFKPLELMRILVQNGGDINAVDFEGNTPFHDAVESRDHFSSIESKMKLIVKFWGSPNMKNYRGQTALHKVAEAGLKTHRYENGEFAHNDTAPVHIDFLLQQELGIDLNARDKKGRAAIHYAASISEVITWKFVQAGADTRAQAKDGRTPLHFATEAAQSNIVGFLCKIYRENSWPVNEKDEEGRTPLHFAARSGNSESVYYLLQAGAEPNVQDIHESTPLHAATEHHIDASKWKRQHSGSKVTVNWKTIPYGLTGLAPFMEIKEERKIGPEIQKDHLRPLPEWDPGLSICGEEDACMIQDVIQLLLSAGASTTIHDESGRTPYDTAVLQNNEEIAIMLSHSRERNDNSDNLADNWYAAREKSAEQNVRDMSIKDKQTNAYALFQTAIYLRSEAIFKSLLEAGVDPLITGPNSLTVAHTIAHFGLLSMMKILSSHVKNLNVYSPSLLHVAATRELSNIQMVDLLIKLGVDVNSLYQGNRDHYCWDDPNTLSSTPNYIPYILALQGRWWNISAIDSLCAGGANLNTGITDRYSNTILKTVLYGNGLEYERGYGYENYYDGDEGASAFSVRGFWSPEILEVVLKHGSNVNELSNGMTPLILALRAKLGVKMIRCLLSAGANVALGKEPTIILAVWSGDLEATRAILDAGADINAVWDRNEHYLTSVDCPVTPLLVAALHNQPATSQAEREALVALLLERGANPLMKLKDGETTVLHQAAFYHAYLEMILNCSPSLDLETQDSQGRTPLLSACSPAEYRIKADECTSCQLILAGANVEAIDKTGSAPLHLATKSGLVATVSLLLEKGADYSIVDHEGFPPLYYALRHLSNSIRLALTKIFLAAGAIPFDFGENGESALHLLAPLLIEFSTSGDAKRFRTPFWVLGDDEVSYPDEFRGLYQQIIDNGCDRNIRDKFGNTPLFPYIKEMKLRYPYYTIDQPAKTGIRRMFDENDVFVINDDGDTLLHAVAARENIYVDDDRELLLHTVWLFKELLARGVDPRKENKKGLTALDVAWFFGNKEILRCLSLWRQQFEL